LPGDRGLALEHVPARHRAAIRALFAIDLAMADVVRTSTQPMLGQIRLAWWRERLEGMDRGELPAEPRLQAVASDLLPRGIRCSTIAGLEGGWLRLFDDCPWDVGTSEAVWFRGRLLFGLGARLLGNSSEQAEAAGGVWALADAARHCSDMVSRAMLLGQARTFARGLAGIRFAAGVRPLTGLAALAVRDVRRGEPFEPEATRGRAAAMLAHRLSGRIRAAG
jgi:phytoene synthase